MKINISDLSLQRPTWAEINLDALHSNVSEIKRIVRNSDFSRARSGDFSRYPSDPKLAATEVATTNKAAATEAATANAGASIMAVIKADAYGHGADAVARELESDVACFGTATVLEAVSLRDAGVRIPILVLGGMAPDQLPVLHAYDFMPVVHNVESWNALSAFVQALGREIAVHIKIDTGMGRLGLNEEDAARLLARRTPGIRVDGLMTHFACADVRDDAETLEQLRRFRKFVSEHGAGIPWIHAANSAAVLNYPESHFNLVRPGLLLYGLSPMGDSPNLTPVLSLLSRIVALRWIRAGDGIGYGRTFRAQRDTLIATLPIGYSDGLRRRLSNRLKIEIRGRMCPLVGSISMDLCMADVTALAGEVQLYDLATFIGPRISAWDWARILDSIAWETFCLLGSRVPRVYLRGGKVVDVYYP